MAVPSYVTGDVPTATEVNAWFVNVTFAKRSATKSVTSNVTLADDGSLQVNVDANTTYLLHSILRYDGATAGDLKIGWVGPVGSSMSWAGSGPGSSAAGYSDDQVFAGVFSSNPIFGALGTGTDAMVVCQGLVTIGGTSGTFKLQWAQGTSNATATRMFADSYISLQRVE